MRYNREAPFRYTFENPIPAYFQIIKIDGESVKTSEGDATIINISPGGAKLQSKLNIPEIDHKSIELSIRFKLNEKELTYNGFIIWKKKWGATIDYGIKMEEDDDDKKELIDQLKIYSKNVIEHGH